MNIVAVLFAVSMCILTWLATDANATKKSKTCGTRNWPACALEKTDLETVDFAIKPTIISPPEDNDIIVTVKLHRTQCPQQSSTLVQWYKLETFGAGSNVSMGKFIEPFYSRRLETYACQKDSTIVFNTCEPHPLDLPRRYTWVIPKRDINMNSTTACFRLTVVEAEDDKCKYTETCIELPYNTSASGSTSGSGDQEAEKNTINVPSGSGAFGEAANHTERCLQRWNCSNAKLRAFCGTDGNTYMSRCHIRLAQCLADTIISINYAGECESEDPEPECYIQRDRLKERFEMFPELPTWLPTCDCDGLVKHIQCDRDIMNEGQLDCWCSYSNSIAQVSGTRRKIVDVCTDPASFEFSCSSTLSL